MSTVLHITTKHGKWTNNKDPKNKYYPSVGRDNLETSGWTSVDLSLGKVMLGQFSPYAFSLFNVSSKQSSNSLTTLQLASERIIEMFTLKSLLMESYHLFREKFKKFSSSSSKDNYLIYKNTYMVNIRYN